MGSIEMKLSKITVGLAALTVSAASLLTAAASAQAPEQRPPAEEAATRLAPEVASDALAGLGISVPKGGQIAVTDSSVWSGFVVNCKQLQIQAGCDAGTSGINQISGGWTVPYVQWNSYVSSSGPSTQQVVVWIGIGGAAPDNTLIHLGTGGQAVEV
jgi:hypothetical protein